MQNPNKRASRLAAATLAAGALALLGSVTPAVATPATPQSDTPSNLSHAASGAVESLNLPAQANTAAATLSKDVAAAFKADSVSTFSAVRSEQLGANQVHRYQQSIAGRAVAGSSIATSTDAAGKTQALGNVATATDGAFPAARSIVTSTKAEARATALGAVAHNDRQAEVTLKREVWFAPAVSGAAANPADANSTVAVPAYQLSVTSPGGGWLVTVSANHPDQVLASTPTQYEINRVVCDANRYKAVYNSDLECGTGLKNKPSRVEGGAASSVADVNSVYTFFGDTSSFYASKTTATDLTSLVGANYNDGNGKAIRGSVRQCISGEACPFLNAFWSDDLSAMVYGEGVTTDDVTGHELTHGVTAKTNGLVYQNEAGAINESMSDIFGEIMDQGNGSADDTAANRWKMGEGSSIGVIRDMKSPKSYGQPDTYKGTYWVASTSNPNDNNDYGGVHTNSGVGNKLAQLLSDGGTHNSVTVTGIGSAKTAQIHWTAQTLLTSNATYSTLATALKQSCSTNAASGVKGITTADCTQVANAIKAVKIP
ncbi:MAG: M4 family metallopeptidase [Arthrobacter sp.]|jgi:Zn-dependent metalloprotease|nr:M4 family metallopeptidase [Arthrobacter sp.]